MGMKTLLELTEGSTTMIATTTAAKLPICSDYVNGHKFSATIFCFSCSVYSSLNPLFGWDVDEQLVSKVGMTFNMIEEAEKFYKNYFKLIISKVVLHLPHLCCPNQGEILKQHKQLSMYVRHTIENNEEARIKPSKAYQSFIAAAWGHRDLIFIEKDIRNYITKEVWNRRIEFFFELELEVDQSIKIAFWANTSKVACEYFEDVNHYSQSTLLGCALMKNEDVQSFKWLFECCLHCMGGNAQKGILIDQCASMQRAIEACMPTIIHRWCIWHIIKKVPNKLNGYK
ncbi:hypothetical protein Ahy_A09g044540 [Arachis hypogaea]|uniref:Protein FAR1-RELATED SEQUENCE n=1 Tax=Arachis hypogaea TaxID=3818 RepID=A0A445BK94_ARAHY|nr:hypothetical protein Ahy_A09g044540 [Arachis hypogaea]